MVPDFVKTPFIIQLQAVVIHALTQEKISYFESQRPSVLSGLLQDVHYIVKNIADKKESLSLLKGVSGILYPGLMTALVGLSMLTLQDHSSAGSRSLRSSLPTFVFAIDRQGI